MASGLPTERPSPQTEHAWEFAYAMNEAARIVRKDMLRFDACDICETWIVIVDITPTCNPHDHVIPNMWKGVTKIEQSCIMGDF